MSDFGSTSPVDVRDVVVGKHPHDLTDRIALADVGEKLVAETGAFGRPLTSPAMSTNVTGAGTIRAESNISASFASRGSGSGTTPSFGSIVANG